MIWDVKKRDIKEGQQQVQAHDVWVGSDLDQISVVCKNLKTL